MSDYTKPERWLWKLYLLSAFPMVLIRLGLLILMGSQWVSGKGPPLSSPAIAFNLDLISMMSLPVLWFWGIRHFKHPKKSLKERLVLLLLFFAYGVQFLVAMHAPQESNVILIYAFFLFDVLFWFPALFLAGLIGLRVFSFHGR